MRRFVFTLSLLLIPVLVGACGGDSSNKRVFIQNKGSDTLVNVAQAWAEAYQAIDGDIIVAVSGGGSGTGISALLNGTVDIANASRDLKAKELEAARAKGIEPRKFIVGYDALAVYVHKDNPIESFTLAQLADIYGEGGQTAKWSQLGFQVPGCSSDEIVRLSRQNNSGTYAYFKSTVLGKKRDFMMGSRDLHGSKEVVDTVEHTPCAIGYSGLAYATDHVKLVPIQRDDGSPAVAPTVTTAVDGSYPIARPLFMFTAGEPTGATKAYLDWILSEEGQRIIEAKGYAPVLHGRHE